MNYRVYSELRAQLFQEIKKFVRVFDTMSIFEKFIFVMGADDPEVLTPFIKFVKSLQM